MTFVLIAILIATNRPYPAAITVEFNGMAQCEAARRNLYGQKQIEVLYSACEKK
jgi:hypothetical protein